MDYELWDEKNISSPKLNIFLNWKKTEYTYSSVVQ